MSVWSFGFVKAIFFPAISASLATSSICPCRFLCRDQAFVCKKPIFLSRKGTVSIEVYPLKILLIFILKIVWIFFILRIRFEKASLGFLLAICFICLFLLLVLCFITISESDLTNLAETVIHKQYIRIGSKILSKEIDYSISGSKIALLPLTRPQVLQVVT